MKDIITKFAESYDGIDSIKDNSHGLSGDNTLPDTIIGILNGIVGVLAVICVIVIVIGGVQYMTSSGDAGKVKKAKDTILYALIGLVICALAAAIVNFVIAKI